MEESSELAQAAILEVIETQMRDNTPPEVRKTFKRLCAAGIEESEAMKFIACALNVEIFGALKHQEPYNESRYIRNLKNLPELPWASDKKSKGQTP